MARPIWKGSISFGLVNVPVVLYSAEQRSDLHFKLIDSRNSARVRYERVNEETGEEVPWNKIVKGFEYDGGSYVLFDNDELEKASAEATRTIDIEQFADLEDIDSVYFDKPYYLVPGKGGEKGYVLLREAMQKSGKVGIARVVIRTRQYMAALIPEGDALVVNLMRFHQELRSRDEFKFPEGSSSDYKVTKKEVDMAVQLVEGLSGEWNPEEYHDEYRDAVMKMIEKKIKSGRTEIVEEVDEEEAEEPQTINFLDVLKKSIETTEKKKPARRATGKRSSRSKGARKSSRSKKTNRKEAG